MSSQHTEYTGGDNHTGSHSRKEPPTLPPAVMLLLLIKLTVCHTGREHSNYSEENHATRELETVTQFPNLSVQVARPSIPRSLLFDASSQGKAESPTAPRLMTMCFRLLREEMLLLSLVINNLMTCSVHQPRVISKQHCLFTYLLQLNLRP